jgi:hypothetical protein
MGMERQQYAAVFRAEKPHETEAFKSLLAQVAVADDDALLRPFLSDLNRAIADAHRSSYSDPGFMTRHHPFFILISLWRCPILTRKESYRSGGGITYGLEALAGLQRYGPGVG